MRFTNQGQQMSVNGMKKNYMNGNQIQQPVNCNNDNNGAPGSVFNYSQGGSNDIDNISLNSANYNENEPKSGNESGGNKSSSNNGVQNSNNINCSPNSTYFYPLIPIPIAPLNGATVMNQQGMIGLMPPQVNQGHLINNQQAQAVQQNLGGGN